MLSSVPLLRRKVKRNAWYGVRIPATLRDEFIWYEVNARFAKAFIIASVLLMMLTAILYAVPAVSVDSFGSVATISLLATLVGLLVWLVKLGEDVSRERKRDQGADSP
ncbi:MAG TPA: SdpI family protein [Polyangiaceae bacterium]|nr:SdpI family protein [Polyangiaceae bacterium]